MATVTLRTYDMIKVGDRIVMPKSGLLVKGGIITKIRKWNQHAMRVYLDNGSHLELSKWVNDYEIYRDRSHIPTA